MEYAKIYVTEDAESIRQYIADIILRFAGQKGETALILMKYRDSMTSREMLQILESSLHAQNEELKSLRKITKQTSKRLEILSQQPLL